MGYGFCAFVMGSGEVAERSADDFAYIGFHYRDDKTFAVSRKFSFFGVCVPLVNGFYVFVLFPP